MSEQGSILSPSGTPVASLDWHDVATTLADYTKARRDWGTICEKFYDVVVAPMDCANCDSITGTTQEGEISGIGMKKLQEWLHRWVDRVNMYKKEVEGSYCGQEVSVVQVWLGKHNYRTRTRTRGRFMPKGQIVTESTDYPRKMKWRIHAELFISRQIRIETGQIKQTADEQMPKRGEVVWNAAAVAGEVMECPNERVIKSVEIVTNMATTSISAPSQKTGAESSALIAEKWDISQRPVAKWQIPTKSLRQTVIAAMRVMVGMREEEEWCISGVVAMRVQEIAGTMVAAVGMLPGIVQEKGGRGFGLV
ncbi:uncharacterized protein PAC_03884 [Phialocephala subalpina]|uniref:Uncharacterized protein n=1 Tax=Phialocephala subalpina TaxID=576137 RepID=A0A1L7WMJ9_9HELO|nr:uncharacterized protein PAC_03884 [Phialocephala subalpina]